MYLQKAMKLIIKVLFLTTVINVYVCALPVQLFYCDFNFDLCNFAQRTNDEFDWSVGSSTVSTHTGPQNGDVEGIGKFAYIEASSPRNYNDVATIQTPRFPSGSDYKLEFYQMAKGDDMGELKVELEDAFTGAVTILWQRSIHNSAFDTNWIPEVISFNALNPFSLSFKGIVGQGWSSDFAIDNVRVTSNSTTNVTVTGLNSLICDFGTFSPDICGFVQDQTDDFDWTINTGSTGSVSTGPGYGYGGYGYYMYIEVSGTSSGNKARLLSPALEAPSGCTSVSFYYHSYGSRLGSLSSYVVRYDTYTYLVWSANNVNTDQWIYVSFNVYETVAFQVRFDGVSGGAAYGDYAIDQIEIVDCGMLTTAVNPVNIYDVNLDSGPFVCNFQYSTDWCGFQNMKNDNFDWTLNIDSTSSSRTGPDCDQTCSGYYAYIEASSPRNTGDRAILQSPIMYSSTGCIELSFYWHGYGTALGSLHVSYKSSPYYVSSYSIFDDYGTSSSNYWRHETFRIITSYAKIIFEGVRGNDYQGDYAIDDITINDCSTVITSTTVANNYVSGVTDMYYYTETGTITSPGYSSGIDYGDDLSLAWYITVYNNRHIYVNIDDFKTESCCDYVAIIDQQYGYDNELVRWQGDEQPGTYLSTNSHQIKIFMHSDSSVSERGISLSWYTMDAGQMPSSSSTTDAWNNWSPWPSDDAYVGLSTGAIVGIAVGVVVVVFCFVSCCCVIGNKKKTQNTVSYNTAVPTVSGNVNHNSGPQRYNGQTPQNRDRSLDNTSHNLQAPQNMTHTLGPQAPIISGQVPTGQTYYNPAFAPQRPWYSFQPPAYNYQVNNLPPAVITDIPPAGSYENSNNPPRRLEPLNQPSAPPLDVNHGTMYPPAPPPGDSGLLGPPPKYNEIYVQSSTSDNTPSAAIYQSPSAEDIAKSTIPAVDDL